MPTLHPPARYALYGLPIEIACDVAALEPEVARLLGAHRVSGGADSARGGVIGRPQATAGVIRPYDPREVVRRLPPTARRVAVAGGSAELYEDGERFWRIDDRWGMVEINLLKSQWRAWVVPQPRVDAVRCAEQCVLWPLAQLLRPRGLYLLPAASVVRSGCGLLLLSPLELSAELTALVRAGCRVVGQRWTALRERDGRIEMLNVAGMIERNDSPSPHMRLAGGATAAHRANGSHWVDLSREHYGCELASHPCDGVFVIQRGRRPSPHLRPLGGNGADALDAIRAGWPIEEMHPLRRHGQLPAKLAAKCAAYEVGLSRDPHDLPALLGALPQRGMGIQVTTHVKRPPAMLQRTAVA